MAARNLMSDLRGASSAEYVVVLALVALVGLGSSALLGQALSDKVDCAAGAIAGARGARGPCRVAGVIRPSDPPPAAPAPALPRLRSTDGVTAEQRALVERQLASLPSDVLAALRAQDTEVVVTLGSVASVYPELRRAHPRGAPPGATFEDVDGVFDPAANRVVVALDAPGVGFAGGDPDVLVHEIGHALDLPRGASRDPAFVAAYEQTAFARGGDGYYEQAGRAGLEETYADSFADFVRDRVEMRARWGEALYRYWSDARSFRDATARDVLAASRMDATMRPFGIGHFEIDPIRAVARNVFRAVRKRAQIAARSVWSSLPEPTRNHAVALAGFAVGVTEIGKSLVELGLAYSPATPRGRANLERAARRAVTDPVSIWERLRAMPGQTARYYKGLVADVGSGDWFRAGRATGMLAADAALTFLPAGAAATKGVSAARAPLAGLRSNRALAEAGGVDRAVVEGPPLRGRGLCFAAGTPVLVAGAGSVPIERLGLGARVRTLGVDRDAPTEVDPATWRVVRLEMADPSGSGDTIEIALLRPVEWVRELDVSSARDLHLVLREMGIEGPAHVRAIEPAPEIARGSGHVVLATIASTSQTLLAIRFEGSDEVLEATASHPLYSLDRDAWVRAGELRAGERLRAASGTPRIASIEPVRGAHRVYNLEIEAEHSFLVSALGVLSHNNNPCATREDLAEWQRRSADERVVRVAPETAIELEAYTGPMRAWVQSSATWANELNARTRNGWHVEHVLAEASQIDFASRTIRLGTEDAGASFSRALKIAEHYDLEPPRAPQSFASADRYASYATEYGLRERARVSLFEATVNEELAARGATRVSDETFRVAPEGSELASYRGNIIGEGQSGGQRTITYLDPPWPDWAASRETVELPPGTRVEASFDPLEFPVPEWAGRPDSVTGRARVRSTSFLIVRDGPQRLDSATHLDELASVLGDERATRGASRTLRAELERQARAHWTAANAPSPRAP